MTTDTINCNLFRVKDIGFLQLGKMLDEKPKPSYSLKPYLKSKNIGWLNLKMDDVSEMFFNDNEMRSLKLKKGDLLFSEGGEVGKTAIWNDELQECYIQNSVHKLTVNKNINPKYILYYSFLYGVLGYYNSIVNLVSIKHLTYEKLRRVCFIIPSLPEQQCMVDYLDKRLSAIDQRVEILEKQKYAYARLKKSIIHQAVTRGLNPDVRLKDSGIDWIGMIPEHWEVKRMKSVFSESKAISETGQENLLSVSEYYGVARRVDKMDDGEYESRAESLIGYKICKKNDLVINIMLAWKRGLGFSDYDGIVSPAYAVYRAKNIVPHFFHYLMRTDMYVAEYKRNSKGIIDSRLRMYTDRFNNIMAIVPPFDEQKAIANYLDEKCTRIDAAIENISKQIDAFKRLKRALINEVITGKRAV